MNELLADPFDQLRAALLDATSRDVARRQHRRRVGVVAIVTVAGLVLLTGIATAASERLARTVQSVPGGSIFDVFHGEPEGEGTTSAAEAALQRWEAKPNETGGLPGTAKGAGKVLLHERIDGSDVEIVAVKRASPFAGKPDDLCWTVSIDGQLGGMTCSPVMIPGLPLNYGLGMISGEQGVEQVTISGVSDDRVESIDVVTDRGIEEMPFGDHAFWWRRAKPEPWIGLQIHLKDGTMVPHCVHVQSPIGLGADDSPPPPVSPRLRSICAEELQ